MATREARSRAATAAPVVKAAEVELARYQVAQAEQVAREVMLGLRRPVEPAALEVLEG